MLCSFKLFYHSSSIRQMKQVLRLNSRSLKLAILGTVANLELRRNKNQNTAEIVVLYEMCKYLLTQTLLLYTV